VGHLVLAAPFLVATCWAELRIMAPVISAAGARPDSDMPIYALTAQLIGWSMIAVATAACIARSRYADLGGAIAAPLTFTLIAFAWYTPQTARFLVKPLASTHTVAIGVVALVLTCAAMRDHWHRLRHRS
jgi:hypothetical protein